LDTPFDGARSKLRGIFRFNQSPPARSLMFAGWKHDNKAGAIFKRNLPQRFTKAAL
jgi:hypothetical protein